MDNTGRTQKMIIPTVIMGIIAVALLLTGYWRGQDEHIAGIKSTLQMTGEILPLLILRLSLPEWRRPFCREN